MMEKFRNLSNNIFFKIFLGFLGLTFVMFGISGFILGNNNSWIAKIGGKTIDYDQFLKISQAQREAIYRANPNKEVLKYLDSADFKQDVVAKIVSKNLLGILKNEYQIYPDENLILQEILNSPALKGKNGKFDRNLYQNFLRNANLTEKQHITDISDQITGGIIVQSFLAQTVVNENLAKDIYKSRLETRTADVVTIEAKNVTNLKAPSDFELNEFFNQHKDKFFLPEMRKVSYISFDKSNLNEPIKVSDEEIAAEYKKNLSDYQIAEKRDFYQILFNEEKEAQDFVNAIKSAPNKAEAFLKLAAEKHKNKNSISLSKISKKDLPTEIADSAFKLEKDGYSKVLKSPLGFHVFYLLNITPTQEIPLKEVANDIKNKLIAAKADKHLQSQLTKLEDELITSGSLEKIADKLHVAVNKDLAKFDSQGLNARHEPVAEIKNFDQFAANAFLSEKGHASRIFYSSTNQKYYAILVEEIDAGRQRSLDEVKVLVTDMWIVSKKQDKLQELANEIYKQIKENGGNAALVASKNGLKIVKNQSFPRFYMIDVGNGKTVPYANKFLEQIFALNINQPSLPNKSGNGEFTIAVLKGIKQPAENPAAIIALKQELAGTFQKDMLNEYNQYIENKFPVKINEKLLQTNSDNPQN